MFNASEAGQNGLYDTGARWSSAFGFCPGV
jgi:hypothetical protein